MHVYMFLVVWQQDYGFLCRTRATILALSPPAARDLFAAIESDEQLIATFLLQERALGLRSEWYPYIQVGELLSALVFLYACAANVCVRLAVYVVLHLLIFYPHQVLPKSIPLTLTLANSDLAEFQVCSRTPTLRLAR